MVLRRSAAAVKDAITKHREEECALSMGQSDHNAAVRDAQI